MILRPACSPLTNNIFTHGLELSEIIMKKSDELVAAIEAARKAGKTLLSSYGSVVARYKTDRSLVTSADTHAEDIIKRVLAKSFPSYSFIGEESGFQDKGSDYVWVVDPLDGTTNFIMENPFFAVSIGLAYRERIIMGVVHYPFQDETFYASRGEGAYLNDKPINISKHSSLETSVITFCHGRDRDSVAQIIDIFGRLKTMNDRVRQVGAASLELCYVACGRTGCFLMPGMNAWDVAAGAMVVREAGGKVSDFQNRPFNMKSRSVLAANRDLHGKVLALLQKPPVQVLPPTSRSQRQRPRGSEKLEPKR